MGANLETHFDMLVVLPTLIITCGECTDPECDASHWRVGLSFLFWTGEVYW